MHIDSICPILYIYIYIHTHTCTRIYGMIIYSFLYLHTTLSEDPCFKTLLTAFWLGAAGGEGSEDPSLGPGFASGSHYFQGLFVFSELFSSKQGSSVYTYLETVLSPKVRNFSWPYKPRTSAPDQAVLLHSNRPCDSGSLSHSILRFDESTELIGTLYSCRLW